MSNIVELSCGNYNCVYGNKEGVEKTYGYCKCILYPHRHDGIGVEKVKTVKWAIHELRRQNKKLQKEVALLAGMLNGR